MSRTGRLLHRTSLAAWSLAYRAHEAEISFVERFPATIRAARPDWPDAPLIAFDVGADQGVYARIMARVADHVIALEPVPEAAERLRRLELPRTEIIEAAASFREGEAPLHDARSSAKRRPEATLEARAAARWSRLCRTIRLASLLPDLDARHPGAAFLLKIDAEGHEGPVLAGAEPILERDACLIVEIEPRLNPHFETVFSWLAARGYRAFRWESGRLEPAGPETAAALDPRCAGRFARLRGYRSNFVFLRV